MVINIALPEKVDIPFEIKFQKYSKPIKLIASHLSSGKKITIKLRPEDGNIDRIVNLEGNTSWSQNIQVHLTVIW